MQRFKRILFVNEPGSKAITTPQRAVQLARANKAQLTLCDASPELPRTLANLAKTYKQLHQQQLLSKFEKIDLKGVKTKTVMLTGTPFIEIIKEVQRGGHDLLIKSAEGSGGTLSYLFGETDMHLMRKCPCPVWIVKPSRQKKYTRIVAAVDPDPQVPANAELNKLIIELAASLARQEGSELHIVHAWNLVGEDVLRSKRTMLTKSEVDEIVQDIQKTHQERMEDLLGHHDLSGIDYKVHLMKGKAGEIIPDLVSRKRADLVVMGTVARTGIAGFFIGNTAEKILRTVNCSVLTVKPKKFRTPVRP